MPERDGASGTGTYIDHPAPGVGLFTWLMVGVCGCIAGLAVLVETYSEIVKEAGRAGEVVALASVVVLALSAALVSFYFWPIYATYYAIGPEGIAVKYGPWKRTYAWSDFERAYWQRGMFTGSIGWPSVTPCVRLTDAVVLKRRKGKGGRRPLYLTPNDSRLFLVKISELAPELTRQAIF